MMLPPSGPDAVAPAVSSDAGGKMLRQKVGNHVSDYTASEKGIKQWKQNFTEFFHFLNNAFSTAQVAPR
jgi:hypothetical protein